MVDVKSRRITKNKAAAVVVSEPNEKRGRMTKPRATKGRQAKVPEESKEER